MRAIRATNTEIFPYLNNTVLLPTPIGKYSSKQLVTNQLDHTNRVGAETTLLLIITEYLEPKVFVIGVSQAFESYGLCLDNTSSQPHINRYDQENTHI